MNRLAQYKADKTYHAKQNLLAHIHKAIAPQLQAMRQADAILESCVGRPQGRVTVDMESGAMDKYSKVYTARACRQLNDLTSDNCELAGASYLAGMDKGETTTRNVADNNI